MGTFLHGDYGAGARTGKVLRSYQIGVEGLAGQARFGVVVLVMVEEGAGELLLGLEGGSLLVLLHTGRSTGSRPNRGLSSLSDPLQASAACAKINSKLPSPIPSR